MAEGVVDGFETVDIDPGDAERPGLAGIRGLPAALDFLLGDLQERAAIGDAGENVAIGDVFKFVQAALVQRDIALTVALFRYYYRKLNYYACCP